MDSVSVNSTLRHIVLCMVCCVYIHLPWIFVYYTLLHFAFLHPGNKINMTETLCTLCKTAHNIKVGMKLNIVCKIFTNKSYRFCENINIFYTIISQTVCSYVIHEVSDDLNITPPPPPQKIKRKIKKFKKLANQVRTKFNLQSGFGY